MRLPSYGVEQAENKQIGPAQSESENENVAEFNASQRIRVPQLIGRPGAGRVQLRNASSGAASDGCKKPTHIEVGSIQHKIGH